MRETLLTVSKTARKGTSRYEEIRVQVETPENIGKLISIDVETGEYAIGDDRSVAEPLGLLAKNPDAQIFTLRIGHATVYSFGGSSLQLRFR